MPEPFAAVDAAFDRFFARPDGEDGPAPGLAWGVIGDGALVHARGVGTLTAGLERPVDADAVFRIASMTKSFTAAAILALRDEGRLRLDDPVARWVPDLATLRDAPEDAPELTVRHLLTHVGGLPTDDPWGDRQQALPMESLARLLRAGPSLSWTPEVRYEYSNLGYTILGRVISAAAGAEFAKVITDRLLRPLAMTASGFRAEDVPPDRLASGHVRRDGRWEVEPVDGYGAAASMGGLFTSIRDLAAWVAFLADAWPPRDAPDGTVLSRASRRELQRAHVDLAPDVIARSMTGPVEVLAGGYGFGLAVAADPVIGRTVGHSGGYPGFGSNMIWHPASGLGVVAIGNARYCGVTRTAREALRILVMGRGRDGRPAGRPVVPAPSTAAARAGLEQLLAAWDDALATRLFAMNVELDEPIARRAAAFEALRAAHGRLARDPDGPETADSPFRQSWWMRGERGRIAVTILLSPEPTPRIQSYTVTSVPDAPASLDVAARSIVAALGALRPTWPRSLRLDPGVDRGRLDREFRVAAARHGPASLGPATEGDGVTRAAWRVTTDRPRDPGDPWPIAAFVLRLRLESGTGRLLEVGFEPEIPAAPTLGD